MRYSSLHFLSAAQLFLKISQEKIHIQPINHEVRMLRMIHTDGRRMMAEPAEVNALENTRKILRIFTNIAQKIQGIMRVSSWIINIVTGQVQDAKIWFKLDAINPLFVNIYIKVGSNDLATRLRVVEI